MKQIYSKLALLATLCAAFMFMSCGDNAEWYIDWSGDGRGTLEIVNTSDKDIVMFKGDVPTKESIIGGVRKNTTRLIDISRHVEDFAVGGWVILQGISREEFNENETNLKNAKVEFSAFATYKDKEKYRVTIDRDYVGDNAVRITNNNRVGMELRKDSPEGEKVAYLPAFKQNQMLYTQNTNAITLFPFYVLYNKSTKSVTTLKATSLDEAVRAAPRPASNPQGIPTAYFPNDPTNTWEKIVGTLKSPVAYVTVNNGVMNQAAYFTQGGSFHYYSQGGYDAIGSGEQLVFEVEATEEPGIRKTLIIMFLGKEVPVLFEGETDPPLIINGYDYMVSVNMVGGEYKATIVQGKKRDLSDQLESL